MKAPTTTLGAFSISLAVADLAASRAFYEKLGFTKLGGNDKSFVILGNGDAAIGLFQGMFERNILTFNPGWDRAGQPLATFTDVRELQRQLVARGITPKVAVDETSRGPAHFMIVDPDGNHILVDQHV